MNLPFFYVATELREGTVVEPPEETARHMVQVLRMREGDGLVLTDGKGRSAQCTIATTSKRSCTVSIGAVNEVPVSAHHVTIAISLLKNAARFEWFLEKAAELGINTIVPLLCSRTEKQHFRKDRAQSILVSAMQQSQQSWLTEIQDPTELKAFLSVPVEGRKYIAHCLEEERTALRDSIQKADHRSLILIGPEGDFTPEEIAAALQNGYTPVTLGETRLRTETAGIAAATILRY